MFHTRVGSIAGRGRGHAAKHGRKHSGGGDDDDEDEYRPSGKEEEEEEEEEDTEEDEATEEDEPPTEEDEDDEEATKPKRKRGGKAGSGSSGGKAAKKARSSAGASARSGSAGRGRGGGRGSRGGKAKGPAVEFTPHAAPAAAKAATSDDDGGGAKGKGKAKAKADDAADKPVNHNEQITKLLMEVALQEKAAGEMNKFFTYMKAIKSLRDYPKKVESGKEAQKLPFIGPKLAAKVQEILDTGTLQRLTRPADTAAAVAQATAALSNVWNLPYAGATRAQVHAARGLTGPAAREAATASGGRAAGPARSPSLRPTASRRSRSCASTWTSSRPASAPAWSTMTTSASRTPRPDGGWPPAIAASYSVTSPGTLFARHPRIPRSELEEIGALVADVALQLAPSSLQAICGS